MTLAQFESEIFSLPTAFVADTLKCLTFVTSSKSSLLLERLPDLITQCVNKVVFILPEFVYILITISIQHVLSGVLCACFRHEEHNSKNPSICLPGLLSTAHEGEN